jgi:hypothetical protein
MVLMVPLGLSTRLHGFQIRMIFVMVSVSIFGPIQFSVSVSNEELGVRLPVCLDNARTKHDGNCNNTLLLPSTDSCSYKYKVALHQPKW